MPSNAYTNYLIVLLGDAEQLVHGSSQPVATLRIHLFVFLLTLALTPPLFAAAPPDPLPRAVRQGLDRLARGAAGYVQKRQCFSCHHQTHTIAAFAAAGRRGFTVSSAVLAEQVEFTLNTFRPKLARVRKGLAVEGGNTMAAYALATLHAAGHRPDDTTAALVDYLLVRQRADGSWPALMARPPSEGSKFTNAALALEGLRHYGMVKGSEKVRLARIDASYRKGKTWLLKNPPRDTEDRVFHLRALVAVEADAKTIAAARAALLKEQRPDGSWAQLPDRGGDAYATATALLALARAGLTTSEPPYRKGVAYLLRTQTAEGAWLVTTRSRPVQTFFDNGDPGGKSQFISFAATGWAVQALLQTLPVR
jgi:hypothetical protein